MIIINIRYFHLLIGDLMTKLGNVRVVYLGEDDKKKSASGKADDKGAYVEVNLNPSKRRTKFNTVLIPWNRIIKVTVF